METNKHSYKLTQKNKTYILTTSVFGNDIKISVKSEGSSTGFMRIFTIDTWKKIGSVFESIQSATEAVQWIDNTLKVQKVKIVEDGTLVKLVFFIIENRTKHLVEIPLTGGQMTNTNVSSTSSFNTGAIVNTNVNTTSVNSASLTGTQSMQQGITTTTTKTTNLEINFSREIGLDPSQIIKQTENANTQEIIKSIKQEQQLRLSQVGKITTQPSASIENINQFQTSENQEQTTSSLTENVDLNQFTATSSNVTPDLTAQFTETKTEVTGTIDTTPVSTTNYSLPYISPADEIESNMNNEIKTETTNLENYTQNYNEQTNYEQVQTTETNETNLENYNQNYNEQANFEQFQTTETTTNTQFDTQTNVQDDRLIKLEGDTNSLRNEHQEIQTKLNNLFDQVNVYKNQLESLKNENNSRELSALRAENASMKQQLSEFYNLKREAAQVQNLRNQVSEIEPLRRKAAELDSLRIQLNELNMLKAKVAELSGLQNQLGEINQLKAQINQMNLARQQKDEISMLREKVEELNKNNVQIDEKEMLRRKLEELENLKLKYEQEIRTIKNQNSIIQESSGLEKNQHIFEEKTQQISVKGDIIHNTDELELITRKINKANKKITLNLLYKATVDSDKAQAFHEKCDEAQSSLVLVETDKGKRFGGFTTCSWEGECIDKKDENAFVFSLDKMMIYENIPGEDAIGCYPKFGPIFLGCQIRIYDNAFSKGGTTFEKGLNYNTEEDYELTGGDRIFNIKEIEVYELIAQ